VSYFTQEETTIAMRKKRTQEVVNALEVLSSGGTLSKKVVSGRYTSGLSHVSKESRDKLLWDLRQHA
jgi:hypothetical protein